MFLKQRNYPRCCFTTVQLFNLFRETRNQRIFYFDQLHQVTEVIPKIRKHFIYWSEFTIFTFVGLWHGIDIWIRVWFTRVRYLMCLQIPKLLKMDVIIAKTMTSHLPRARSQTEMFEQYSRFCSLSIWVSPCQWFINLLMAHVYFRQRPLIHINYW